MTIYINSAEGGTADTAVTGANSGGTSGTAFTAVTAAVQYKSDIVAFGSMAFGWSAAGAVAGTVRWALGDTTKVASGRHYFYLSADLADGFQLVNLNGNAGAVACFNAYFTSLGNLRLGKSAGTNYYTSTWDVSSNIGEWLFVDWQVNTGTTTTDGTGRARIGKKSDNTYLADTGVVTGDFGAGALLSNVISFKVGPDDYAGNARFDQIEVRTGADSTGLIGPYVAWSVVGGATVANTLSDDSDSTYLESPSVTATEVFTDLYPVTVDSTGVIGLRLSKTNTGSASVTVRAYSVATGGTVLETWTVTPTTSIADYPRTLATATRNALTANTVYLSIGAKL